jgi:uncharacterized repeat protein (TIGR02543 family)
MYCRWERREGKCQDGAMKKKFRRFLLPIIYGILAAVVLLLPGQLSAKQVNAQSSTSECWAVIVGVSDYQNFSDLQYADDDAQELADQLSPVWGSDHVILLIDSAATKQNIEDAMTSWLPSREDANDVVFFYHSGYLENNTGYLYTYDSLISSYNNDISANELDSWLDGLDSKKIVVMGVGGGKFYDVLAGNGRILLAQSTGGEGSWEIFDLGHEVFTYYVLEALSNFKAASNKSNYELSVEEIFNYAKTKTSDYINYQHPQMSDGYQGELIFLIKATADVEIEATQASSVLTIDGKAYSLSSLPVSFIWAPGSSHDIQATSTVSGASGTQYVFDSWNDGNTSSSKTISDGGIYTAEYQTQYFLTVASAFGQPTGQGWYNSGSMAAISVVTPVEQAGTKRIFTGWSGDYTGNTASASVTMTKPKTVMASWKTQYYLTVTSVYSNPAGSGWYDSGSTAAISIDDLVEEAGTKHYFTQWSGDYIGDAASTSVIMNLPKTVNAEWSTDYLLTVVSEYGDAQGAGWYNSGTTAAISVTSPVGMIVRQVFNGWSGDLTGDTASASVTMDQPKTVTANWKNDFLQLYILIIIIAVILGGIGFWLLKIRKRKAPVVSSEAAPLPPSPKRCANCGAEIEPGDAFCIKCGKPVKDN